MSKRMNRLFAVAKEQANRSSCNYRLGACVVKRRKVLGKACNAYKTHPETNKDPAFLKGLHAELGACLNTSRNQLEGSDLFVVRILKNNSLALSRPCVICQEVLKRFGVSRVFYTMTNSEYGVLEL